MLYKMNSSKICKTETSLFRSRFSVMFATTFASMIWFVVDWCLGTTFRSMSMWELWVNNLLVASVLMLPFVMSRRVWLQILWLFMVDIFMMANLMYSRTYFTAIPPDSYGLVSNLSGFTESVWYSLRWCDIGFVLILVAGTIFAYRLPDCRLRGLWVKYGCFTAVLAIISVASLISKGGLYKTYHGLAYGSKCGVPAYTIPGHLYYVWTDNLKASDPSLKKDIQNWLDSHNAKGVMPALPDSVKPRKNLVVILLESFESWVLEKEIDGKPITPYLNSLLADSSTFYAPKMLTQVDCGRSIDAQLLLTAGMLPPEGTVYSTHYPTNTYLTLNKALKQRNGGASYIMSVDKTKVWNFGEVAKSFGYDSIFDKNSWVIDEKVGQGHKLSDGSFFRQSVDKIKEIWKEGEPVMITLVTYSGHHPFLLPRELEDPDFNLETSQLHSTLKRFAIVAHYTDSHLRKIVEYLQGRSDWEDTMVVITGDHEGLMNERNEIIKSSPEAASLVDKEQFTPFIILNSPLPGRYGDVLGQVDMYPTLLGLLGGQDFCWQGMGRSVFAADKIPAAISSMMRELVGDTVGFGHDEILQFLDARRISDAIIRSDYLKTMQ